MSKENPAHCNLKDHCSKFPSIAYPFFMTKFGLICATSHGSHSRNLRYDAVQLNSLLGFIPSKAKSGIDASCDLELVK